MHDKTISLVLFQNSKKLYLYISIFFITFSLFFYKILEGHQNYTRAFKLQIIDEAKRMSNNTQVARNHGISEYSVRLWRKNEEKIRKKFSK